jgi:hypothetical protein
MACMLRKAHDELLHCARSGRCFAGERGAGARAVDCAAVILEGEQSLLGIGEMALIGG